jgi:hypothetical protein
MECRVVRILIRVPDIENAAAFYDHVLGVSGLRASSGRHHIALANIELCVLRPRR